MPLLKKGVPMPVEGLNYSAPSIYISPRNSFHKNMSFWRGEIKKRTGKTAYGSDMAGGTPIRGFGVLEMSNGSKYLLRNDATTIEKYVALTQTWESIASAPFTGGDDDFMFFANVVQEGKIVYTNLIDAPRYWAGSGNDAVLAGSPPKAKYLCYLSPYLLMAYTDDGASVNPWGVSWCDTGNIEEWADGNSGQDVLGDEPSDIQNIVKLNEFAAIYKERSLWLAQKVSSTDVFQFTCTRTGIGLLAPRSVVDVEGRHYFMGTNDFYVWNGIREESIGGPVRDEVYSRIDRSKYKRMFAIHVQEFTEVWFFIVISGESWPTEVWKYNYRTGFWYFDTCEGLTAATKWRRVASESWNEDTPGTWDQAQDLWDSGVTTQSWEDVILGTTTGRTIKASTTSSDDLGTPVEAVFISPDFTGDIEEIYKRWLQLDVWIRGVGRIYVDYSTDFGDTWINIPYNSSQAYIDADGTHRLYNMYFDVVAEKIRFRIRNNRTEETFFLRNYQPYYLGREQKRA